MALESGRDQVKLKLDQNNLLNSHTETRSDTVDGAMHMHVDVLRDGLLQGLSDRAREAKEHALLTSGEIGGSFLAGAGMSFAMKAGGRWKLAAEAGAVLFTGLMAYDLSRRGQSLHEAYSKFDLKNQFGREMLKESVAKNLGAGIFDYSLSFASGGLGFASASARFRPSLSTVPESVVRNSARPSSVSEQPGIGNDRIAVISNEVHGHESAFDRRTEFNSGLNRTVVSASELPDPYTHAAKSVVEIWGPDSIGNGFIASHEGLVVTDNHVVAGSETWNMRTSDGRTVQAKVVSRDPANDLAILALRNATNKQVPFLGEFGTAELYDDVAAVSRTKSKGASLQVSMGEIEEITKLSKLTDLALPAENIERPILLATYPSYPGMSGAPVVRLMDGKVIGVVNGNVKALSSGFATPAEAVSKLLGHASLHRAL
ncbi:MAG: serine protease [Candidatus Obscuribacterales bacterium]|nr:serine protease [Candidatus Obscuribacterales bacterium]